MDGSLLAVGTLIPKLLVPMDVSELEPRQRVQLQHWSLCLKNEVVVFDSDKIVLESRS